MQRPVFTTLRWSWLLGFALFAPAALPAGGAERRNPEIRRRDAADPWLSAGHDLLQASPHVSAPALRRLKLGTPLRVLRHWRCDNGDDWVQVQMTAPAGVDDATGVTRGWLHG